MDIFSLIQVVLETSAKSLSLQSMLGLTLLYYVYYLILNRKSFQKLFPKPRVADPWKSESM